MKKVALVACRAYPELSASNAALAKALTRAGADVEVHLWNASPREAFLQADLVLLRQTWDYIDDPGGFAAWAMSLERSGAAIRNAPSLAVWNNDKRTLRELAPLGIAIPATIPVEDGQLDRVVALSSDKIVLKPAFGGGGVGVALADKSTVGAMLAGLQRRLPGRAWLAQEYLPEIADGEWKLTCFGGRAELAVHLRPQPNEFRVNTRFDPEVAVRPVPDCARRAAERVCEWLGPDAPCLRLDGVIRGDQFICTELELTDPDLFLHLAGEAICARLASLFLTCGGDQPPASASPSAIRRA